MPGFPCGCTQPVLECETCTGDVPAQVIVSAGSGSSAPSLFRHFSNTDDHVLDHRNDGPPPDRVNSPLQPGFPFSTMGGCYWTLADGDWVLDYWFPAGGGCRLVESQLSVWSAQVYQVFFGSLSCIGPHNPSNAGASKYVEGA
jgi:hypothetical protein